MGQNRIVWLGVVFGLASVLLASSVQAAGPDSPQANVPPGIDASVRRMRVHNDGLGPFIVGDYLAAQSFGNKSDRQGRPTSMVDSCGYLFAQLQPTELTFVVCGGRVIDGPVTVEVMHAWNAKWMRELKAYFEQLSRNRALANNIRRSIQANWPQGRPVKVYDQTGRYLRTETR